MTLEGPAPGHPLDGLGSSLRILGRNLTSRVVGAAVAMAFGAVVGIFVARGLGPSDYGLFSVSWTILGTVAYLAPLGLDVLLVREINRRAPVTDLRGAVTTTSVVVLVISVGLFFAPRLLGLSAGTTSSLTAGILYVVATGPLLLVLAALAGREHMVAETGVEVLGSAMALAAGLVALGMDASAATVVLALGVARTAELLLAVVVYWRVVGRRPSATPLPDPIRRVKEALPMGMTNLLNRTVDGIDLVILGWFVAPELIGWFSAALAFVLFLPVISDQLVHVLYPVMSRAEDVREPELRRMFSTAWTLSLAFGLAAAVGAAVTAEGLVTLVYGREYGSAAPFLVALAWYLPSRATGSVTGAALDALGRQGARFRVTAVSAATKVVLAFVLVPFIGVWGAVVSRLVKSLVSLVGGLLALRPLRPSYGRSLGQAGLLSAGVGITAGLVPGHVLLKVTFSALVFLAGAWLIVRRELDAASGFRRRWTSS